MASRYSTDDKEDGSEEIIEMYCELCKKNGKYQCADGFCVNCVKYFCKDCLRYHEEFLPDHVHKDKTDMPQDVCLNPCPQHKEEVIKFYCSTCNMYFCSECKKIDHKKCKDVHHLPELVKDLEKGTEFLEIERNLETIEKESKDLISTLYEAKKSVETMSEKALSEIDLLRDRLIKWVNDRIEAMKSNLKFVEDKEIEIIQDECSKLSVVTSEASKRRSTMERKKRESKRCELFMAMKDTQSKMKTLQDDILQTKVHQLRKFHFEANSEIQSLLENPIELGDIASRYTCMSTPIKAVTVLKSQKSSVKEVPDVKSQKSSVAKQIQPSTQIKEVPDVKSQKSSVAKQIQPSTPVKKVSDVKSQKSFVANELQKPLIIRDVWYIIDIKWFKQWKSYVGYEDWDHFNVGEDSAHPGPIDNTPVFQEGTTRLKEHLIDDLDYVLVPEECWKKLVCWYGLKEGQVWIKNMESISVDIKNLSQVVVITCIIYEMLLKEMLEGEPMEHLARQVIEEGVYSKSMTVEVYQCYLKLCENSNLDYTITKEFSRSDTVDKLEKVLRREFSVPSDKEVRLWHRYMTNMYVQLNIKDRTLQGVGLYQGQVVVIEQKNPDGIWPRDKLKKTNNKE